MSAKLQQFVARHPLFTLHLAISVTAIFAVVLDSRVLGWHGSDPAGGWPHGGLGGLLHADADSAGGGAESGENSGHLHGHEHGHGHGHARGGHHHQHDHRLLLLLVLQLLLSCALFATRHHYGHHDHHHRVSSGGAAAAMQRLPLALQAAAPELLLVALAIAAALLAVLLFVLTPSTFWCPRWAVHVDVLPSPPVSHIDPHGPYSTSDLVVVTGATAGFFDRMSNMVGSLHVWEPEQRIIVYDLGFTHKQLKQINCWRNVQLRRFEYSEYPKHVRDVRNYAFKTLVIKDAMKSHHTVLWIDSGLELRAPMHTLRKELAAHGHVSALQEDAIGDPMYTYTRTMVDFFNLGDKWDTIRKWQFCAGGLQGFVRGSDADRLVLQPVVNCSLSELECIAPPGSSRDNHNYDQTALTIMIWEHGFSCLPRETHCMWSVKKASRDPLQLSDPIEMVSRGHRLPKPYIPHLRNQPHCDPGSQTIGWPEIGREGESTSRHGMCFKITNVYIQPIGDVFVTAGACPGTHIASIAIFLSLVAMAVQGVLGSWVRTVLLSSWGMWSGGGSSSGSPRTPLCISPKPLEVSSTSSGSMGCKAGCKSEACDAEAPLVSEPPMLLAQLDGGKSAAVQQLQSSLRSLCPQHSSSGSGHLHHQVHGLHDLPPSRLLLHAMVGPVLLLMAHAALWYGAANIS